MTEGTAELRPLQVEMNGINVISESERKSHPRDLFWPWFAAKHLGARPQLRLVRARLRHLVLLATATVFHRLGWGGGDGTKVVALIVVVALTIFGGVMGFDLIMRMQTLITIVTGVATVVFIALVADHIHWHTVSGIHSGSAEAVIGALVFV
jgi:hypothetical protein